MNIQSGNISSQPFLKTASVRLSHDILNKKYKGEASDHERLLAAVAWIKRAQDASDDHGVSYGYYLRPLQKKLSTLGWRDSYVETSGYIIETLYDIGENFDDLDAMTRAEQIGHWLLSVQNVDGSFSNDNYNKDQGIVFDTGQVLFGLARCYKESRNPIFERAGKKAALWLADVMDTDGAWRKNTHKNAVNTYNSRVAWAMLEMHAVSPDRRVYEAAVRNLDWVLQQQLENGFFENCAFGQDDAPFTHTIAYAIRGLLEGARLTHDARYFLGAVKAARAVAEYVKPDGFLAGRIAKNGRALDDSCCLTGNCQMAIIWYQLAEYPDHAHMREVANLAIDYVMSVQDIKTSDANVNGAVKGSHPIWGKYTPFAYPNWATKFFIEALLYKEKLV